MMIISTTSHHIAVESTRDIATSRIDRKHLRKDNYEEVDDDGQGNLGASPTAMA